MFNTNSFRSIANLRRPDADGGAIEFNRFANPRTADVSPELKKQFKEWQKDTVAYVKENMEGRANNPRELSEFIQIQLKKYPELTGPPTSANIAKAMRGNEWSEDGFTPVKKYQEAPRVKRDRKERKQYKAKKGGLLDKMANLRAMRKPKARGPKRAPKPKN